MQTIHRNIKTTAICLALLLFSVTVMQAQVSRNAALQANSANRTAAMQYKVDAAIPTPIMNKLITDWGAHQQQDIANDMRVEVWQVSYVPYPNAPNTTEIVLQQKMNVNIGVVPSNDGVAYSMSGMPSGNNLVVLLYCAIPTGIGDLQIGGKVSDGTNSGGMLKQYVSDVKTKLNNRNIVFGIYSLTPTTNISGLNFTFSSASLNPPSTGVKTMDFDPLQVVGDAVNAIGSAISAVVNEAGQILNAAGQVIGTVAGWVIQMGGQYAQIMGQLVSLVVTGDATLVQFLVSNAADIARIIAQAPQAIIDGIGSGLKDLGNGIIAVALGTMNFILYGNLPHMRQMTQQEYDWANAYVYNGSLPALSKLKITNLMTVDHRECTIPMPDGSIQLNLGDAWTNPIAFGKPGYDYDGMLFIHELGHAWQIGRYGAASVAVQGLENSFLGVTGKDVYTYYPDCNDSWMNYNLEQQATIIDASFAVVYGQYNNIQPPGAGSCKTEAAYTIANVRAGLPMIKAVIDNIFYAYYLDPNAINITGGPNGILAYSKGNINYGDGYWMAGHKPDTYFYYSNKTGKGVYNYGPIRDKYANTEGAEHGLMGWPVSNIIALTHGGYFEQFQNGNIYWTPSHGAYAVQGQVMNAWGQNNFEKGPLGYPISDFIPDGNGGGNKLTVNESVAGSGYQQFENGIIKLSGGINSQSTVVLNSALINKTQASVVPKPAAGNPQGTPGGLTGRLRPGEAQSLNPQPLPPKIN